jgi:hypothetical protein
MARQPSRRYERELLALWEQVLGDGTAAAVGRGRSEGGTGPI